MSYTKLEDILGRPIEQWVYDQLNNRSQKLTEDFTSDDSLRFRVNRSGWVRLVSGVDVTDSDILTKYYASSPKDLAKRYVLYGGLSSFAPKLQSVTGTIGSPGGMTKNYSGGYYALSGFQSTYNVTGDLADYGYRPMPGIKSVKINTAGKLGSIKMATVQFTVNDKAQLDIIDLLYFKLGYMMFLEWGNTNYIDRSGKLKSTEEYTIDPFEEGIDKDSLRGKILQNVKKSEGNYDGMIGIVTNFNFSFQNGVYNCDLSLMGLGILGETLRMNNTSTKYPELIRSSIKELVNVQNLVKQQERNKKIKEAQEKLKEEQKANGVPKKVSDLYQEIKDKPGVEIEKYENSGKYDDIIIKNNNKRYLIVDHLQYQGSTNKIIDLDELNAGSTTYSGDVDLSRVHGEFHRVAPTNAKFGKAGDLPIANVVNSDGFNIGFIAKNYTILAANAIKSFKIDADQKDRIAGEGEEIENTFASVSSIDILDNDLDFQTDFAEVSSQTGRTLNYTYYKSFVAVETKIIETSKVNVSGAGAATTTIPRGSGKFFITVSEIKTVVYYKVPNDTKYYSLSISSEKFISRVVIQYTPAPYIGEVAVAKRANAFSVTRNEETLNRFKKAVLDTIQISTGTLNKVEPFPNTDASKTYIAYELEFKYTPNYSDVIEKITELTGADTPAELEAIETWNELIGAIGNDIKLKVKITDSYVLSETGTRALGDIQPISTLVNEKIILYASDQAFKTNESIANEITEAEVAADPPINVEEVQKSEASRYASYLQLMLRAVQLYSYAKASQGTVIELSQNEQSLKDYIIYFIKKDPPNQCKSANEVSINFIKEIFSNGALEKLKNAGFNYLDDGPKLNVDFEKDKYTSELLYGFSKRLMGLSPEEQAAAISDISPVKFEDLLVSYVMPYNQTAQENSGAELNYPCYIPLGFLFMIFNHVSLLYERDSNNDKRKNIPMVYLDFNPDTNLCLRNGQTLTMDPYKFLIPYNGEVIEYQKLFDETVKDGQDKIKKPAGKDTKVKTEELSLWNPREQDGISRFLPVFTTDNVEKTNNYRGKTMNILVNLSYVLNLIENKILSDESNSLLLKPTLEDLMVDLNKCLGNFNYFRVGYDQDANCFYVTDDQSIPSPDMMSRGKAISRELPLYGKYSIAESFDVKTEFGTKLANLLAISANSDTGGPTGTSTAGKDASSIAQNNRGLVNRYAQLVGSVNDLNDKDKKEGTTEPTVNDTTLIAAIHFNNAIKSFYYELKNSSQDKVNLCMNYYIERMTKVKVKNQGTRASALIPVTLNFSTDGISGMYMGNAFTVPEEILPYSYNRTLMTIDSNGEPIPSQKTLGFIITGLDHSIENNRWKTNVKANMYYLKELTDYDAIVARNTAQDTGGILSDELFEDSEFGGVGEGDMAGVLPRTTNVPNADELRKKIAELNTKHTNPNRVTPITYDNDLSSWADITENLLQASSKMFDAMLEQYPDLTVSIGNANDVWHAEGKIEANKNKKPYASPHPQGRGMDFNVGPDSKYGLSWKKEGTEYVLDKNGRKFGDPGDGRYAEHNKLTSSINAIITKLGLPVYNRAILDEYMQSTPKATGPHYHLTVIA